MVSDAIAIAIAIGSVQAINYFVAQKYVEASTALATAPNRKFVLMPMESSGIIGSIAGVAELAKEAAGKPDAPVRVPPMPPRAGACAMRWDVAVWAMLALLLIAAETLVPGAFLLWMGIAAAAVRVLVLVLPNIALLWQVVAFVLLSFVSVQVYRTWFRSKGRQSDRPLLNRPAEQLIGGCVLLDQAIHDGRGRAKVDDAFWVVAGPDLPAGTPVRIVGADGMGLLVQPAG